MARGNKSRFIWILLFVIHALLAFTTVFSAMQIIFVTAWLGWLLKEKDWRRYIFLTAIPLGVCFFYYAQLRLKVGWLNNPMGLAFDCISTYFKISMAGLKSSRDYLQLIYVAFAPEWLVIMGVYIFAFIISK